MLKREVAAYAADLGISVNALVAVALRDYLDSRLPPREGSPDSVAVSRSTPASALQSVNPGTVGVGNRADRRAKKR